MDEQELIAKAVAAVEAYQWDYACALAKIAEALAAERQAAALERIAAVLENVTSPDTATNLYAIIREMEYEAT